MAARTLRKAAVAMLAVGCLLSSAPVAVAANGWSGLVPNARSGLVPSVRPGLAPNGTAAVPGLLRRGDNRCPQPPPPPNLRTADEAKGLLWPQSTLGLSQAGVWYLSRGKGVTVAVVDTGIDKAGPAFSPDTVLAGPSVVDRGESANYDCDGHGTAVAAIIAGSDNGIPGFSGVAPDARILPIRQTYLAAQPGSPIRLADAIRTATAAGARVINISMGTTEDSPELRSAVQDALERDVVVVAAAGSGGPASSTARQNAKYYPAAIPGVLGVAAVDRDGDAASFGQQGRGAVLAAPGGRLAVPAAGFPGALTAEEDPGFAAAFVAGTAALVLAYRPNLHNWQVAQRLEMTADRSAPGALGAGVGWGVVNPYLAVVTILPGEGRPYPSLGPSYSMEPASAAVPGSARGAEHVVLGVAGGGLLVLAVPVVTAALRRGRVRGARASA